MEKKFVSRAGEKLQFAIDSFDINIKGLVAADFGSSTGGFVDCLLQNGVTKVYAVDTCYGELDWKLRNDSRVIVMERTNAMHVKLPEKADLITIDTGWTKQEKVLPNAFNNIKKDGIIISLIKPHYEEPKFVRRGKLDEEKVDDVVTDVKRKIEGLGGNVLNFVKSPIVGDKGGNIEYLSLVQEDLDSANRG